MKFDISQRYLALGDECVLRSSCFSKGYLACESSLISADSFMLKKIYIYKFPSNLSAFDARESEGLFESVDPERHESTRYKSVEKRSKKSGLI